MRRLPLAISLPRVARVRGALVRHGAALLVAVSAVACSPIVDDTGSLSSLTRVRPRVVVDGLIELSGRTDGRLFVDEVIIHAGTTELRGRDATAVDLLASDPTTDGPLVFRYKLGHSAASSTSCGVERDWDLSSGDSTSDLVFGFSPFSRDAHDDAPAMGALGLDDIDLTALDGATALIHGFVAVPASVPDASAGLAALAVGDDVDDLAATGGDPDGAPGKTGGDAFGGDPDGAPGRSGGVNEGGDPDGAPGRSGGVNEGGDPDGAPGKTVAFGGGLTASTGGDPDGAPGKLGPTLDETVAGGDPDGAPGRTHASAASGPGLPQQGPVIGGAHGLGEVLVPFVLVLDDEFALRIPFASLRPVGRDEVLPIDVHVDAHHLFTLDLLAQLTARATEAEAADEAVSLSVEGESHVFDVSVAAPVSSPSDVDGPDVDDPSTLEVSADGRDEETNPQR